MTPAAVPPPAGVAIAKDAPIDTWFGVGGGADALATPPDVETLRDLLLIFAGERIRILGDGANLLVDDDGVDGLVIDLANLRGVERVEEEAGVVRLRVGAGVSLPRLVVDTIRDGLVGLEGLGGIPATIGGAVVMNAGGVFGEIGDAVRRVEALTRFGQQLSLPAEEIDFDYRRSGLEHLVVTAVELELARTDADGAAAARRRLKETMARKKATQPLAERSAGCCFKNPTVAGGRRVSAGQLIDAAGCKGLRIGGAEVSDRHANFVVTRPGCTARDVIALLEEVRGRVARDCGVELEPEVRIWRRAPAGAGS